MGFIPGWLKAKTGAHEVINTIMMNYIAFDLVYYLIAAPCAIRMKSRPKLPGYWTALHLYRFFPDPHSLSSWFFLLQLVWQYWSGICYLKQPGDTNYELSA